jgi:CheY-like chemotaxis protein
MPLAPPTPLSPYRQFFEGLLDPATINRVIRHDAGVVVVDWTIEAVNQAEQAVRDSEARLTVAKEAASPGIHDCDVLSGTVTWDARVREPFGVGDDEPITYDTFVNGVHPDDRQVADTEVRNVSEDRGAEFIVRFPLTENLGEVASGNPRRLPAAGRRLKVLVVDDNTDLVEMLSTVVEAAGHDAWKAFDGQSGISAALRHRPDVVLLDLGLPDMDGCDVARALRREPALRGAYLVALTGWGQQADRQKTQEAGFDQHLTKPADPGTLTRLLAEIAARQA